MYWRKHIYQTKSPPSLAELQFWSCRPFDTEIHWLRLVRGHSTQHKTNWYRLYFSNGFSWYDNNLNTHTHTHIKIVRPSSHIIALLSRNGCDLPYVVVVLPHQYGKSARGWGVKYGVLVVNFCCLQIREKNTSTLKAYIEFTCKDALDFVKAHNHKQNIYTICEFPLPVCLFESVGFYCES